MCNHEWKISYKSYKNNVHVSTTLSCYKCQEFKEEDGDGSEISSKRLDETDRRLDQTIRTGRAHGKNINNLRSQFKNGKWNYKYIK